MIDSHHHLWIPERRDPDLGYGWLRDIGATKPFGDPTPIQRDYEWAEYCDSFTSQALTGSVFVQTDGALPDPVAETAWVQSVFDGTGLVHAIVGLIDLASPSLGDTLTAHAQHRCFRGVRQILSRLDDAPARSFAPRHFVRDEAWRAGFASLADHDLVFDLQCYPEQMAEIDELLAAHPRTRVVLDHAGSPHATDRAGLAGWRDGVQRIARHPQVCVKLSGFGMFDAGWSAASIAPLIETLVDAFTPERLLFGSNAPVETLSHSIDAAVREVGAALAAAGLDDRQRGAAFDANVRRVYRPG